MEKILSHINRKFKNTKKNLQCYKHDLKCSGTYVHAQKYARVDMQTRLLRMIKYKEPDPFQVQQVVQADT